MAFLFRNKQMTAKSLPNELVFATFSLRSECAQAEIRNVHMPKVEWVKMGLDLGLRGGVKKGFGSDGILELQTRFRGQMATTQQVLNSSRCPWLTDAHYSEFNKQFTLNVLRLMAFSASCSFILAVSPKNKATLFAQQSNIHTYIHAYMETDVTGQQ